MRLRFALLATTLLAGAIAAHATSVTYALQGYTTVNSCCSPITVTGTATLNIMVPNPTVTSIMLSFSNGASESGVGPGGYTDGHSFYVGATNNVYFTFTDDLHNFTTSSALETFNLNDTFANMTTSYVGCAATPGSSGTGICQFQGSMTPISPTPEPSSIALLSTGLLGAVGLVRRRYL